MASATLHRPTDDAPSDDAPPAAPPRRSRLIVGLAVAVLVAAVWFAPAMVARSGYRHRFVHLVVPAFPGLATVGSASLGWFSPVVLRDVRLTDPAGGPLLSVAEFRTAKPLAALLRESEDFGTLTFVGPELELALRSDGSNLEDAIAPVLAGEGSATGMTVVVEGGRVRWTTPDGKPGHGAVESLSGTVRMPHGRPLPDLVELSGRLTNGEAGGDWSVRCVPAASTTAGDVAEVVAKSADLPLTPVADWLTRFGASVELGGTLAVDLRGRFPLDGGSTGWTADGRIDVARLRGVWRERFGDDVLLLESVTLSGEAGTTGDAIALRNVRLVCDAGSATVTGTLRPAALPAAGSFDALLAAAFDHDLDATADLDVARLAAVLPRTLRFKQKVESGKVSLGWKSAADGEARRCDVRLNSSDLVAGEGAERLVWKEPVAASASFVRSSRGVRVERLDVSSDVATVSGSGDVAAAEFAATADLDLLRDRLGRFVELPPVALAGRADARLTVTRDAETNCVRATAGGSVKNLDLSFAGGRWTERDLGLAATVDGRWAGGTLASIGTATLDLKSVEGDELSLRTTEIVAPSPTAAWPVAATLKGDLARWLTRGRAAGVVPVGPWSAGGSVTAAASFYAGPEVVSVSNYKLDARQVRVTLPNQVFDEAFLTAEGSAKFDRAGGVLSAPETTFASETIAGRARDLRFAVESGAASGRVEFRGGVGRLGRYLLPADSPLWLSGVVGGTLDLSTEAAATVAAADLNFEKPVLSRATTAPDGRPTWETLWDDDRATLSARGRYHHIGDELRLDKLTFGATGLSLETSGKIDKLTATAETDLAGAVAYDLDAVAARFRVPAVEGIAFRGASRETFAVRGRLRPAGGGVDPALAANAGFGWQAAELYGFALGAGRVPATLDRRTLSLGPLDCPVGDGRLAGSAAVSLDGPPVLTVARGRVSESIAITPDLCRTWIGYAAPALADSAEVRGTVSFDVERASLPLLAPRGSAGDGTLVVGGLEATPGPVAASLLGLVREVRKLAGQEVGDGSAAKLIAPPQNVKVTVAAGRVAHDRLELRLGKADGPAVYTTGSVGFDETLDLVAEIPLDASWFRDERVAAAVGGQTLRVPIRGTLDRPAVDPRALQDFARRAAVGAAQKAIESRIEKQIGDPLRKLLGPRGSGFEELAPPK